MKIPFPREWGYFWVSFESDKPFGAWKKWSVSIGLTIFPKKLRELKRRNKIAGKNRIREGGGTN